MRSFVFAMVAALALAVAGASNSASVATKGVSIKSTGFSPAKIDSSSALDSLAVDRHQGTALYDAIVLAAQQLGKEENPARVIIVLTDGADVSSESSLNDAV